MAGHVMSSCRKEYTLIFNRNRSLKREIDNWPYKQREVRLTTSLFIFEPKPLTREEILQKYDWKIKLYKCSSYRTT
jgi:hypothetical protein